MKSTILVTGGNGMLGQSLQLEASKYDEKFVFVNREFGDLTSEENISSMYKTINPDFVINTAAKVGGVANNMSHPADFFDANILINTFMLKYARLYEVKKFISISSVCALPYEKYSDENNIHNGPPHPSNFAYAYAKRMVDVQLDAYIKQYKLENYCCIIPSNLYGPNDLYNLDNAHVIPALIHKIYLAKHNNTDLNIWGTGKASRDFVLVNDLSYILLDLLLNQHSIPQRLIVANDQQYTINTIVDNLVNLSEFNGHTVYDTSKPEGPSNRSANNKLFRSYYPKYEFTKLNIGLKMSYEWFINNYPNIRK